MPRFHDKCRPILLEKLAAGLSEVRVSNGSFPVRRSFEGVRQAQRSLPQNSAQVVELKQIVDEDFLSEFAFSELSRRLMERGLPWSDQTVLLSSIAGFEDPHALGEEIIGSLEDLPARYRFSLRFRGELGSLFSLGVVFAVGDDAALVHSDSDLLKDLPTSTGSTGRDRAIFNWGLLQKSPPPWDGTYFVVDLEGHVGVFSDSEARRTADDRLKQFLGMALALGLLRRRHAYVSQPPELSFLVHRLTAEGAVLVDRHVLDRNVAIAFDDLELAPKRDIDTNHFSTVAAYLLLIAPAFEADKSAARVALAAQWFFDSETSDSPLLGFVQAMVCLEILYGDKAAAQKLGLNELLKNRCAYSIGNGAEDRAGILKSFDEIYDVRSRIVHTGHSRLTAKEREHFQTLRWYCRRAIYAETEMLTKAKGAG